jgi:hypothetical protein
MSATEPPPPPPGSVPSGPPPGGPPWGYVPQTLNEVWYKPGLNILLAIITLGFWTWAWTFHTAEEQKKYKGDGIGGPLSLIFAIIVNPVVWFTIPYEVEQMYHRDGRQSPVSTLWGLWFLLPIIGNFVWYLRVQRALNEFWLSKGTSAA